MPKWALKYITDTAQATGFTRDRVLDDLLKAGAVALKGRYRSIVQYRESVETLWNEPMTKAAEPQPEEQHVEESTEGIDWTPDVDFGVERAQSQTESARIGQPGFGPFEERSGQLAPGPAYTEVPEPPASDLPSRELENGNLVL